VTWWRMGKSTRVRSPSEAAGSASRDGAATAAALRPRLEEEDLTKPLPIAEPGKQQRSAAAAAMRAVAGLWERRGEPVASACGRLDLGPPRQGQAMASAEGCATDRRASSSNIPGLANVSLVALAASPTQHGVDIHSLYVLSQILSSILNSSALISPLYHLLSTLSIVGSTCHFI
jgi:hypothetical protein